MPAAAVPNPPWADGTWPDTAWEEGTWGLTIVDIPEVTRVTGLHVGPASLAIHVVVS